MVEKKYKKFCSFFFKLLSKQSGTVNLIAPWQFLVAQGNQACVIVKLCNPLEIPQSLH